MLSLQGLSRDMRMILAQVVNSTLQEVAVRAPASQQPSAVAAVEGEEFSPKSSVKDALTLP
jgi:hypothetical protein